MTAVTVSKTIGSTGVFSTPQLWEDGAPADLTTAEKSAATTFLVAAFVQGESLTFVGSGATGKLLDTDSTGAGTGSYVTYGITTGNPAASDVVTGGTSGATCVLTSGTPLNVGVVWQGQCQNQEFSSTGLVVDINGSTNSTVSYKELTTVAGASFRDNANVQSNALRYNASNGCGFKFTGVSGSAILNQEGNTRLSNLQLGFAGGSISETLYTIGSGIIENMLIEGAYTGDAVHCIGETFKNCIIIQRASGASTIIDSSTGDVKFYNCTIVASDDLAVAPTAIISNNNTATFRNCGIFAGDSSKAIKSGVGAFAFTTCYSDISGTTGVTQTTYGNEFQNVNDATRDFRLKAGAAQIETGTEDSVNARIDIAGTPRASGSLYDVGCWEYVQSSAATNEPKIRLSQSTLHW